MGSLIDELQRPEAAARAEAEDLRGRIAELSGQLAQAEERLSRLVITRETVEEVQGGPAPRHRRPPSRPAAWCRPGRSRRGVARCSP